MFKYLLDNLDLKILRILFQLSQELQWKYTNPLGNQASNLNCSFNNGGSGIYLSRNVISYP